MKRPSVLLILATITFAATAVAPQPSSTVSLGDLTTTVFRGAVIGYAVKQSAGPLNKFINTVTLNRNVPNRYSTKVVPIISVGEKTYAGGAQVSGPASLINKVKVVWQYEDNLSNNRFRIKVLVPSNSLNPLKINRVEKVGVSAMIDMAATGRWQYNTNSRAIRAGDVLLAGGVAVAIKNYGSTLNKGINTISFNKGLSTRVVPMASFGEKAYIGGGQISGSANVVNSVHAIWQYEDFFSNGKFRVKILVPSSSLNPLKLKRVHGAGVTAIVEMSLARQQDYWDRDRDRYLYNRTRGWNWQDDDDRNRWRFEDGRHDNGKHKGWYKGKHKGWNKKAKGDDKIADKLKVKLPF